MKPGGQLTEGQRKRVREIAAARIITIRRTYDLECAIFQALDELSAQTRSPVAWVASNGEKVLHLSKLDGWNVEIVMTEDAAIAQER